MVSRMVEWLLKWIQHGNVLTSDRARSLAFCGPTWEIDWGGHRVDERVDMSTQTRVYLDNGEYH